MRIPSGKTDQVIYFVAVDSTDLKTRETGLSSFTVYRSRNGGAATVYTTPTVSELSSSNMPGVYSLLIDEDTTIASTSDSEEYVVHITQASMAPVTRTIELYRRDTTSGQTITVANGAADADLERIQGTVVNTPTVAGVLEVDVTHFNGTAGTFASGRPEVNTTHAAGTAWGSGAITAASIASNAITSAKIATDAIGAAQIAADAIGSSELAATAVSEISAAVWAEATRTLTALDEDSTTIDLDATIAAAVPSAGAIADAVLEESIPAHSGVSDSVAEYLSQLADWSTLLSAATSVNARLPSDPADASDIDARFDTVDTNIAALPTAAENATELLDQAAGVETNRTLRQALRLMLAVLAGKASGMATTTAVFRDTNDSKDRVTATVDADGNRTAVTLDAS